MTGKPDAAFDPSLHIPWIHDVLQIGNILSCPVHKVSLLRLYTLRLCYLILSAGLGLVIWPAVIHHSPAQAVAHGIQLFLFAGLGLTAVLGLRYPVQMFPLLLFDLIWKAIYLLAFALPLWLHHQVTDSAAADIQSVLVVVVLIPLIPWTYVVKHYVVQSGDRWKRVATAVPAGGPETLLPVRARR
jgi:hypothetical protein